ncbi:MAG TPA: hypothetical protein VHM31_01455 [Polyangia bacterium]|nr:hypothetical protein [Polyangia bacterium]
MEGRSGAEEMIARATERYGGRARWERMTLSVSPTQLRGLLPWMKGVGRTFRLPARAEIVPARAEATFFDYPTAGATGRFVAGRVALGDAPLAEHRETFRGLRKWRRWSPLDALYFFGYALTHYHAVPFILADAEPRGWDARRRALTVRFAPTVHTHCPVQTFWFDESGLILRHDYVADIVGFWARGAHYWHGYTDLSGFPFATHRRVVARVGRIPTPLLALEARFEPPSAAFAS